MTTVAIMQPYLFPYIGYYQLAAHADVFVFLDDVNYRKGSFINRNYLVDANGGRLRFTFPVQDVSPYRSIDDHLYADPGNKLLKTIRQIYGKTVGYGRVYPWLETIIRSASGQRVSALNAKTVRDVIDGLGFGTRFLSSSEHDPESGLGGQDRVLHLCQRLDASVYVNLPGGRSLYDPAAFARAGIDLRFLDTTAVPLQGDEPWHPSFLHNMLTRTLDELAGDLSRFRLAAS